ncbi:MAG: glycine cleavage system aminomethyltransferase GcvT [Clostridia bacterium]|nr:glycine cleavage system aminomethyltransferase GcvT [Clostridia bacterium]
MSELKRTVLYNEHLAAGATMVDFGGWDMPIQYPAGIVAEHLFTRSACGLFDVSHMGRLLVEGPQRVAFLQYALTSNVEALTLNRAQYCMIPNERGGAVDDAYLYMFEEDRFLLVVNASNKDKDLKHLLPIAEKFDVTIRDISDEYAAIAVQGPLSRKLLEELNGGKELTEPKKNACGTVMLEGHEARLSTTGYTGEPIGYEVYMKNADAVWLWKRLGEMGAKPAGLGARDTLRLESCMPLYGHELGTDHDGKEIPIFAVPLAKFAVSFLDSKGDFVGKAPLQKQFETYTRIQAGDFSDISLIPRRVMPICLVDRGVIRGGMTVYKDGKEVGWITSGTMIPYYDFEEEFSTEKVARRSIGLAYLDTPVQRGDFVEVDVRGKRLRAVIPASHMNGRTPPYARPIVWKEEK